MVREVRTPTLWNTHYPVVESYQDYDDDFIDVSGIQPEIEENRPRKRTVKKLPVSKSLPQYTLPLSYVPPPAKAILVGESVPEL